MYTISFSPATTAANQFKEFSLVASPTPMVSLELRRTTTAKLTVGPSGPHVARKMESHGEVELKIIMI